MKKMIKRILAILATSMLLGSNGISYAAETAAGDGIAGTEEVSQESEAGEQMESPGDSEESGPAYEDKLADRYRGAGTGRGRRRRAGSGRAEC